MERNNLSLLLWRGGLLLTMLLVLGAVYAIYRYEASDNFSDPGLSYVDWSALAVAVLIGLGWLLYLARSLTSWHRLTTSWGVFFHNNGDRLKFMKPLLAIAPLLPVVLGVGFARLILSDDADILYHNYLVQVLLLWVLVVLSANLLRIRFPMLAGWKVFLMAALLFGVALRVYLEVLEISTYPLSLSWSEGSRYFYSSLFFDERLYGVDEPPTILHPTRYMMQAVPFLFGSLPIWAHRAWQVVLYLGLTMLSAALLTRRVRLPDRLDRLLLTLGIFLFIYQGPIFYHLLVMVVLVLWGYDKERFWRSLLVVGVASAWGGISRVNWIPWPAGLAIMLYFIEVRVEGQPLWRYLLPPTLFGAFGLAAGFGMRQVYVVWSGVDPSLFDSSFTSNLFWYRLWPSATYRLGILPGIALVSLPVLLVVWAYLQRRSTWHPIRWLGIAGVLFVFFAGGLVVSIKIGGGGDLHNMDGYIALLVVFLVYLLFDRAALQPGTAHPNISPGWISFAVGLAVIIPLGLAIERAGKPYIGPHEEVEQAIAAIKRASEASAGRGEEVLFISERQLLLFGQVQGVPLVDEYERVFLMEMAMARNDPYLRQFQQDMLEQRFGLIITSPDWLNFKDSSHSFGEENNAWVWWVLIPMVCSYEPLETYRAVGVQLLVPRAISPDCPELP